MYAQLQRRVQACVDELVSSGKTTGLQVAVSHRGQVVVEAWAGISDIRTGKKVDRNMLFPVFSVTKGVATTLVHILAQAGQLTYDEPLSKYWPEFACRGKESITMRMVLSHTAGIPQLPIFQTREAYADFEQMATAIAELEPLWTPGTEYHYHAVTFGWLSFKPLKNLTGCTFNELVRQYLGADCYCGMTQSEAETLPIAWLEPNPNPPAPASPETPPAPSSDIARLAIPPQLGSLVHWMNDPIIRCACIPASTGIMNARFIAGMYGKLAHGEIINPDLLAYAVSPIHQPLVPPDQRGHHALGYVVDTSAKVPGQVFGHGGYGGSNAKGDLVKDFAVAVLKNRMDSCDAFSPVWQLVQEMLD